MILVFDLDDTLYNELDFVCSGFKAVSLHLWRKYKLPKDDTFRKMQDTLEKQGRGKVFNELLDGYTINTKTNILECLKVYRHHKPRIKLTPEALDCLKRFKKERIFIVTDGHKIVQQNKIKALGLSKRVEKAYVTHQYGNKYEKPSLYCFNLIAKHTKAPMNNLVYIGDNPTKDFVNNKKAGIKTIRVLTGAYANKTVSTEYDATYSIKNLNELTYELLNK